MNIPSIDQLKRALHIGETIEKLQAEMASIFGRAGAKALDLATSGMKSATKMIQGINVTRKKPKFSKAAREAIAAGQRKRWAKVKAGKKSKPAAAKATPKARKKKGKMSAAGRANIIAAQKTRWDKVKKAKAVKSKARKKKPPQKVKAAVVPGSNPVI